MYVPTAFGMEPAELEQVLRDAGASDLVTHGPAGLVSTLLPFVHDPTVGEHGALRGHLARANEQWQHPTDGDSLVIVRGPDAYVTPSWYASTKQHGRVVPTWNYVAVHVYGQLRVHDDVAFVRRVVEELTTTHEAGRPDRWDVGDAPAAFVEGQLRAIVGVELLITRVEAKAKVSQNRPAVDVDGVVEGLRREGDEHMADLVESHRRPAP